MKLTAAIVFAAIAQASSASETPNFLRAQGRKLAATCDNWCNDPNSDYCKGSPLADLSVTFQKPASFAGTAKTYAKCYVPWEGDGMTVKVRCPPLREKIPAGCETCGYSWSNTNSDLGNGAPFSTIEECCPGVVDDDGYRFQYNYDWNIGKAKRGAYPASKGSCWAWWGCDDGYSCQDRSWWGKGTCKLSSDSKFLNEACSDNTQCNKVTSSSVAMACSRVSKKCLLKEDADREHSLAGLSRSRCSCSLFDHWDLRSTFTGLISCVNYKDCGGAECTLTTMDGNKYCHHTDASNAKCSNCRADSKACAN